MKRSRRLAPLLLLASALQLALLTDSCVAASQIRVCGTPDPSRAAAQVIQAELNTTMQAMVGTTNQTLAAERLASSARIASSSGSASTERAAAVAAKPATGINVNVYFHVLRSGTAASQGNIPDSQIQAQIQVSSSSA